MTTQVYRIQSETHSGQWKAFLFPCPSFYTKKINKIADVKYPGLWKRYEFGTMVYGNDIKIGTLVYEHEPHKPIVVGGRQECIINHVINHALDSEC